LNEGCNGVEGVEQEMRIQLHLKGLKAGLNQPGLQFGFASLARFGAPLESKRVGYPNQAIGGGWERG
jgi:hypothetical protein